MAGSPVECANLECRKAFQPTRPGHKYCSPECRYDARDHDLGRGHRRAGRVEGMCVDCGAAFEYVLYTKTRLRCDHCRQALRDFTQSRAEARYGDTAKREPLTRADVFERDGWICQICLELCDREAPVGSPHVPTIDHIAGPDWTSENLRCAHHSCNAAHGGQDRVLGVCEICGADFRRKQPSQRTCSRKCGIELRRTVTGTLPAIAS